MKHILELKQTRLSTAILLISVLLAAGLHYTAAYHFPTPWCDEDWFLTPAINFAQRWSLQAPELNAPNGMFWMPDGFYVVYGMLFKVLPVSLETARWISFGFTIAAVTFLFLAARRIGITSQLLPVTIAIWLISPACVLMGNIARMEALMLAVVLLALFLVAHRQWLMGIAVCSLAALVHPAGVIPLFCFVAIAFLFQKATSILPINRVQAIIFTVILALWFVEAFYFLTHLSLVQEQMAFQFEKKVARPVHFSALTLGLVIFSALGLFNCWRWRKQIAPEQNAILTLFFFLCLGFRFVNTIGQEMWYVVYGSGLAIVLLVIAFLGLLNWVALRDLFPSRSGSLSRLVVPFLALCFGVIFLPPDNMVSDSYTMLNIGFRHEWNNFQNRVIDQLKQVDESLNRPALIQIETPSGTLPILNNQKWTNLQFVYPTAVTPLNATIQPDYLLITSNKPDWLKDESRRNLQKYTDSNQLQADHKFKIQSKDQIFEFALFWFKN